MTKCVLTNVHRIPNPEAGDEEKLRLPFSVKRGQGPNQSTIFTLGCELIKAMGLVNL